MNKGALAGILGLAVLLVLPFLAATKPEKPLFTFMQISDLHTGGYENQLPEAPITDSVVQDIITERNFPQPDFVIISGDLAHHFRRDEDGFADEKIVDAELKRVKEILGRLRMPWHPVVGNHDVCQGDYTLWDKYFPGRRRYDFEYGDYLFVALDYFHWENSSPECKERRQWVRDVLEAHADKRVIIITHVPLIEMKLGLPHWLYVDGPANPSLKDIIDEYDNVVAVLSGHIHLNNVIIDNGIYHIGTAGVCSFPYMYRHFEVYENRIEVKSYSINKRFLKGDKSWEKQGYSKDGDYTRPEFEDFVVLIK